MKNKTLHLIAIITLLFFCNLQNSYANHIYGADIYYEYLNNNNYRISLAFYGDCIGNTFNSFPQSAPEVGIYNGTTHYQNVSLALTGPGIEVTPVCLQEQNNTQCTNPQSNIPGIKKFIYSATVNLNQQSANWIFKFNGNMGSGSPQAGRSTYITTIQLTSGSIMALEARLNNTVGNNTSPVLNTLPTPFYCLNNPQQYNPGAVDANNDQLTYSLVNPMTPNGGFVTFLTGFSATNPLGLASGNFSFNGSTGQINFTPTSVQRATMATKIEEYRNNVLVGSMMREMTFVILSNCANASAIANVDTSASTYQGGMYNKGSNVFASCVGTPVMKFRLNFTDTSNRKLTISYNNIPAGASATISQNSTTAPYVDFYWNTTNIPVGSYTFFLTIKDDACPLSNSRTQAITIKLYEPPTLSVEIVSPTKCVRRAYVKFTTTGSELPRNLSLWNGNSLISTQNNSSGIFYDSLAAGTYTFTVSYNDSGCSTSGSFTVVDSGVYPFPPKSDTISYCLNDPSTQINITPAPNTILHWYDTNGNPLSVAPTPITNAVGIYIWYVSSQIDVCESNKVPIVVRVSPRPTNHISVTPTLLCTNDKAIAVFTGSNVDTSLGAVRYNWSFGGGVATSGTGPGPYTIYWPSAGVKKVVLTLANEGCTSDPDSAIITVKLAPTAGFDYRNICLYDSVNISYNQDTLSSYIYRWSFGTNASISQSNGKGPFNIKYNTPGVKAVKLIVEDNGCKDSITQDLNVYEVPDAQITTIPTKLCMGDTVSLTYTGDGTPEWSPQSHLLDKNIHGNTIAYIVDPVTYTLTLTNEFGCTAKDSITFDQIEPCCAFSYPTAFSPNKDGRNDRFRIVTYGNHLYYLLSIYNRYGERIYYGTNPDEGWDGTYNGKDLDLGVYFYYLDAKCVTGYHETKKGEFTLVR